jgi:hypothetical protein
MILLPSLQQKMPSPAADEQSASLVLPDKKSLFSPFIDGVLYKSAYLRCEAHPVCLLQ